MRYAAVAVGATTTTLACADPQSSVAPQPEPLRALAGRDSAVFVLARSDYQTYEPVVYADIDCPGGPARQQTIRDTLVIWANGRAREASVLTTIDNGLTVNVSNGTATGNWTRNTMPNVVYFSAAPSIVLNLEYALNSGGSLSGQIWLRSEGDSAFTRLHPRTFNRCIPGVKVGSESIFAYTRR